MPSWLPGRSALSENFHFIDRIPNMQYHIPQKRPASLRVTSFPILHLCASHDAPYLQLPVRLVYPVDGGRRVFSLLHFPREAEKC